MCLWQGSIGTPQPPPVIPPVVPPASQVQLHVPHAQMIIPSAQSIQPVLMAQLNRSHLKPEFTGKPDGDMEAHLLRVNDWMDTPIFPEGVKVQNYCLTLVGEARLWYESLSPIALHWNGLQNQF